MDCEVGINMSKEYLEVFKNLKQEEFNSMKEMII